MKNFALFLFPLLFPVVLLAQHHNHAAPTQTTGVEAQPLLAQALRLQEALTFSGNTLSPGDAKKLSALRDKPLTKETVAEIQKIFDPYCLNVVDINPEGRVKVLRGAAQATLVQGTMTLASQQNFKLKARMPRNPIIPHLSNQKLKKSMSSRPGKLPTGLLIFKCIPSRLCRKILQA
jgi:hypothetical protein